MTRKERSGGLVDAVNGCHRCGACCRHLLLEADLLDAEREPLIAQRGSPLKGPDEELVGYLLNGESPHVQCVFLDGNRCTIYPTRPNMCVAFGPTDERCACRLPAAEGKDHG